ncbi:MAG: hypothetical protein WAU56_07485 [Steroidobacteraceae bacterium]
MSRTLPWFSWYPNDFMGAVRGWSTLQRGGYRDALDAQWVLDGLPVDPEELRKTIGVTPTEFRAIWPKIEPKFPIADDGRRRNPRLERERQHGRQLSEKRSELGRIGALKRWKEHGNSHSNSHDLANGKTMASTVTVTSTTRKDPDSEAGASRKRARPASPNGPPARPSAAIDESDPEIRRRREQAAALAESAAKPPTTEPAK